MTSGSGVWFGSWRGVWAFWTGICAHTATAKSNISRQAVDRMRLIIHLVRRLSKTLARTWREFRGSAIISGSKPEAAVYEAFDTYARVYRGRNGRLFDGAKPRHHHDCDHLGPRNIADRL